MIKKLFLGCLVSILLVLTSFNLVRAESKVCAVYFTGIGCPHCAKADPLVLEQLPQEYEGKFVVIEYEIYQHHENIPVFQEYDSVYNTGLGVPLILFGKNDYLVGDRPMIENLESKIDDYLAKGGNECPMIDGSSIAFDEMNTEDLPGSPKILMGEEGENPITGEVFGNPIDSSWFIIGGLIILAIIILICFKMGIRVNITGV